MAKRWLSWTVEVSVDKKWVEDGFDLTRDRMMDMLQETLPFASGFELRARILRRPDHKEIRKLQGFK